MPKTDGREIPEQDSFDFSDAAYYTCAFTGHRSIKPEHEAEVRERLSRAVEYAYSVGCRIFYAGGAVGFDTLAAREVIKFGLLHPEVELHLVLPCINQDERWSEGQRAAYEYVLANAESVEYVAEEYDKSCMKRRNTRLAELGDIIIAYLYRSGTGSAQTVRVAKNLGKTVYNIAPGAE